jgi:Uma2 family endonuclease
MTVAEQQRTTADGARTDEANRRVVLHGIDWRSYERFLEAVGNRSIRLTYDRGTLEIMAPLWNHEWWKRRLDYLILALAEELNLTFHGGGSPTIRRKDKDRGLEPDECYYFRNEPLVRGKLEVDFTRDPPPDLAIEVDITSSSLDRMSIYAALGVPELWRFESGSVRVYHLQDNGEYAPAAQSLNLPFLPVAEAVQLLEQTQGLNDLELLRACRAWVRQRVVPLWQAAKEGQ